MNNLQVITKPRARRELQPQILETEIFQLHGETINRVIMAVNGCTVQIIMHDESPYLTVAIGDTVKQVHILDLDEYILNTIGA